MAIAANALTTLAKVKAQLGITDTSKDTIIESAINNITQVIQSLCGGRNFLSQNYVEVKDGKGHDKLFLNQYPATAVSVVEYRSGTPSTPIWNTYLADNYYVYLAAGYIQTLSKIPRLPQCMRVSYTAGYLIDWANELSATHTLPFDLTGLATELVCGVINKSASQGVESMSTEGQSITFNVRYSDLTDMQKNVLAQYTTMRYAI